jgi:hypothetical protein
MSLSPNCPYKEVGRRVAHLFDASVVMGGLSFAFFAKGRSKAIPARTIYISLLAVAKPWLDPPRRRDLFSRYATCSPWAHFQE